MAKADDSRVTLQPWQVLESTYPLRDRWMVVRSDRVRLPDGTILPAYHAIEAADWVSCIAVTPELEIILIEQYRHPFGRAVIELPAGSVEKHDASPEAAMRRELLEETGFVSEEWHAIGSVPANPARHTNRSHGFLAFNVRKIAEPTPERGELLCTRRIPWAEFRRTVTGGALQLPAPHVACLFWLQNFIAKSGEPAHRRLALF